MPKVTVLILNYNHARFLKQRIQSVLDQTYQDFEILYLDDASTDQSAEVFAPYSSDGRIRSIINASNSGNPFKQWNKGVSEAQGEYIWIAEADDYADKHLLERLVQALEEHPTAGIAYCQSVSVDEQGKNLSTMKWWTRDLHPTRWNQDFFNSGTDECEHYLVQKNTIPNASAVVFRKKVYLEAGGADENMKVCGDWKCWTKCLLLSDIAYVAQPLNFFRKHDRSVRHQTDWNGVLCLESFQMLEFFKQHCVVCPKALHKARRRLRTLWLNTMFHEHSRIPWERSIKIYRLASQLDPHLCFYISAKVARGLLRRLLSLNGKKLSAT